MPMVAVVIPIYKEFSALNSMELKSLDQCAKVLNRQSVYFVGPCQLAIEEYVKKLGQFNSRCSYLKFDDKYFADVAGYNQLLISSEFYSEFTAFDHVLIYQLDAWIFRDELEYWSGQPYSYIGAPWFNWQNESIEMTMVGNGGFSLRNVRQTIRVLEKIKILKKLFAIFQKYKLAKVVKFSIFLRITLIPTILKIKVNKFTFRIATGAAVNEDYYWCKWVAEVFPEYKVSPVLDAIGFSFECNPSHLFSINKGTLPMGCHAWEKHEPLFWRQYIDVE